uniref:Uncharacterized protein n=1 Tax=Pyrodinium bahamense TaxID=73915 RepID=A0A7S0A9E1_9DINO
MATKVEAEIFEMAREMSQRRRAKIQREAGVSINAAVEILQGRKTDRTPRASRTTSRRRSSKHKTNVADGERSHSKCKTDSVDGETAGRHHSSENVSGSSATESSVQAALSSASTASTTLGEVCRDDKATTTEVSGSTGGISWIFSRLRCRIPSMSLR